MYKILKGDCMELMETIEAGSVDMILTDPPYGMGLKPQRAGGKFKSVKIKNDDSLAWTDCFFSNCFRVSKNNTASMFFCNQFCIAEFIFSARAAGYEIKNILVWNKGNFGIGGNWRPCHELILLCTKGRLVTHSKNLRTIIDFKKVHHSKSVHPTQKPSPLLEHLILEPDYDTCAILDPFMGSGSTGVACASARRRFIGIEQDEKYFEIARGRISKAYIKAAKNDFIS